MPASVGIHQAPPPVAGSCSHWSTASNSACGSPFTSVRAQPVYIEKDERKQSARKPTLFLSIFQLLRFLLSGHQTVAIENLALRLQLAAFQPQRKRPVMTTLDRVFWVSLRSLWSEWRRPLYHVQQAMSVSLPGFECRKGHRHPTVRVLRHRYERLAAQSHLAGYILGEPHLSEGWKQIRFH
jgi:hypothetical protein